MNRLSFLILTVTGAVLIVYGITAVDSFSSDISRFFTGAPTDKAIWLLIAGIVVALVGATGLTVGTRSAKA